jgi:hypothetical protein
MPKGKIEWELSPGKELTVRFKPPFITLIPKEAVEHVKVAGKEMKLAIDSLAILDGKRSKKTRKSAGKRTRIELE